MKRERSILRLGEGAALRDKGCVKKSLVSTAVSPPVCGSSACAADWTLVWLVFADSDIDDLVLRDMFKLLHCSEGAAGEGPRVAVHAVIDTVRQGSWRLKRGAGVRTGTLEPIQRQLVSDPSSLTDLLKAAITESPARRYGLVLSGHGSVYLLRCESQVRITVDAVSAAVRAALPAHLGKLDFVSWNACLMSSVSTVVASAEFAHYATAYESYCSGNGFMVQGMLSLFTAEVSTKDLLLQMQQRYLAECMPYAECRLSVLGLEPAPLLVTAVQIMQRSFSMATFQEVCAQNAQNAGVMVDFRWPHAADMLTLARIMHSRGDLMDEELAAIVSAVDAVVLCTVKTPALIEQMGSCGISIALCLNADSTDYDREEAWRRLVPTILRIRNQDVAAARAVSERVEKMYENIVW
jgi:hypothetical protein